MYKLVKELTSETVRNSLGKEKMIKTNLADFDFQNPRLRLYSMIQVKPGEEIEYHMHVGESEWYFFLSGKGICNDNGTKLDIVPGLATLTTSGQGHSVKNTGDEPIVFLALILAD